MFRKAEESINLLRDMKDFLKDLNLNSREGTIKFKIKITVDNINLCLGTAEAFNQ